MIGTRQRFHYPNYGTPVGYPDCRTHSGQMVRVVSLLQTAIEDVDDIYIVEADDGVRFEAMGHELGETPDFKPHDPAYCGCKEN